MFRPQSIGPWPVVQLGNTWNPSTQQVQGFPEDQVRPVFRRRQPAGDYDSVFIDENSDFSVAAQSGFSLGLAIDGDMHGDLPHHIVYSLAVSIHSRVTGANNRAGVNLRGWLGRYNNSSLPTASSETVDQNHETTSGIGVILLPNDSVYIASDRHAVSTTDREFSTISCTGQLVLDSPDNVVSGSTYPLWIGFSVHTPDGESSITISNIAASMHLHKYAGDIDTFSPTR